MKVPAFLGIFGALGTSDHRERVRHLANRLRGLTVHAKEAAPHPFSVAEAGIECDRLDRQPTLLQQKSRCFKTEILDSPRRREPGFEPKQAAELTRADAGYGREALNRQIARQVAPRKLKRHLHAVRARLYIKERRIL